MDGGDRFISDRAAMQNAQSYETFSLPTPSSVFANALGEVMFPQWNRRRILFGPSPSTQVDFSYKEPAPVTLEHGSCYAAPGLVDDFYRNPLVWLQSGVYVALSRDVYRLDPETRQSRLLTTCDQLVSSLAGTHSGEAVFIGSDNEKLVQQDLASGAISQCPSAKAFSMAMRPETHSELAVGGVSVITHVDTRAAKVTRRTWWGTGQKVPGLHWLNSLMIATGDNGDTVRVYDVRSDRDPVCQYAHLAGIKALSRHPSRNWLASGGGIADRTIKIYDYGSRELLSTTNTGSQVCGLSWLNADLLVSSHGFCAESRPVQLWNYNARLRTLTRVAASENAVGDVAGRSLYLARNHRSLEFYVASSNQTLTHWKARGVAQDTSKAPEHRPLQMRIIR